MKSNRSFALTSTIVGLALVFLYCFLATLADGLTKSVAQSFSAAQMFFFSGIIGALLASIQVIMNAPNTGFVPRTPRLLAFRSALFVISCVSYFYAFKWLAFAEVFGFIALVPLFAGVFSGPILNEPVRPTHWFALLAGSVGILVMYPQGLTSWTFGNWAAVLGAVSGALSMVMARLISRVEENSVLQVLYPNLAIASVMVLFLPFVWKPMNPSSMAMVAAYGVLLFAARWVLVLALTRLKAYVATPLINIQFAFMLTGGYLVFGEIPSMSLIVGACLIIASGLYLLYAQHVVQRTQSQLQQNIRIPAE